MGAKDFQPVRLVVNDRKFLAKKVASSNNPRSYMSVSIPAKQAVYVFFSLKKSLSLPPRACSLSAWTHAPETQAKRLAGGVLFAQLREKTMREHGHMARPGTHMFRANRTS